MKNRYRMTIDEFDVWVINQFDHSYEFIGEEAIMMVPNVLASRVTFKLGGFLFTHLQINPSNISPTTCGGYKVNDGRYIPDIGFIHHHKQIGKADDLYYPIAPDLAVEVISNPNNRQEIRDLRVKLVNYLQAGTTVWVIDPYDRTGEIYTPNQPIQVIHEDGFLTGGDVLPDLSIALKVIFPPSDARPVS